MGKKTRGLKKMNRRGFTLIELIVVMIIIGILVLLATPRFINYVKKAEYTRIINETKVVEDVSTAYLTKNEKLPADYSQGPVDHLGLMKEKESYIKEGEVNMGAYLGEEDLGDSYSNYQEMVRRTRERRTEPPVGFQITGTKTGFNFKYYKLDEDFTKTDFSTRLKGDFLINEEGLVIYVSNRDKDTEDLVEKEVEGLTEANLRIKAKFMNIIGIGGDKYWTREEFETTLKKSEELANGIYFNNIVVQPDGTVSIIGKVMSEELWAGLKAFPGANPNIPYRITVAKHVDGKNIDVIKIAIESDGSAYIEDI